LFKIVIPELGNQQKSKQMSQFQNDANRLLKNGRTWNF